MKAQRNPSTPHWQKNNIIAHLSTVCYDHVGYFTYVTSSNLHHLLEFDFIKGMKFLEPKKH